MTTVAGPPVTLLDPFARRRNVGLCPDNGNDRSAPGIAACHAGPSLDNDALAVGVRGDVGPVDVMVSERAPHQHGVAQGAVPTGSGSQRV